eukprot:1637316-Amphidinium_carterae.2
MVATEHPARPQTSAAQTAPVPERDVSPRARGCVTSAVASPNSAARQSQLGMSPPRGVLLQQLRLQPSRAPIPTRDVSPPGVCYFSTCILQAQPYHAHPWHQ